MTWASLIADYRQVVANLSESDPMVGVIVPRDFATSFKQYLDQGELPEDSSISSNTIVIELYASGRRKIRKFKQL